MSGDTYNYAKLDFEAFQSRYRAAFHFRVGRPRLTLVYMLIVSISLSSGFSFQVKLHVFLLDVLANCFNLVIERLFISGCAFWILRKSFCGFQSRYRAASHFRHCIDDTPSPRAQMFQSRYRAASHFRRRLDSHKPHKLSFNLVIERLLISGNTGGESGSARIDVSISLSSGFSFQVTVRWRLKHIF